MAKRFRLSSLGVVRSRESREDIAEGPLTSRCAAGHGEDLPRAAQEKSVTEYTGRRTRTG
jgi:hypothetical protein